MARENFIGTSALVKALVDEPGSDMIRPLIKEGLSLYTSELCVAETLGVLKSKYRRKELSKDRYFGVAFYFTSLLRSNSLNIESLPITDPAVFFEAEELGKLHDLDLADALQIVTLQRYTLASRLITADKELATAARSVGLQVWDCLREPRPDMD